MSPRIVSWKIDEPRVSPSLSSASSLSIVSMNTISSETHMRTTEATGMQPAEPGAKLAYFSGSVKPTADESFMRHNTFFQGWKYHIFGACDALYCAPGSPEMAISRRHTLLCSSILFLSGLGLLLHQVFSARRP